MEVSISVAEYAWDDPCLKITDKEAARKEFEATRHAALDILARDGRLSAIKELLPVNRFYYQDDFRGILIHYRGDADIGAIDQSIDMAKLKLVLEQGKSSGWDAENPFTTYVAIAHPGAESEGDVNRRREPVVDFVYNFKRRKWELAAIRTHKL